jgi:glucuronate isomerase
LGAHERIRSDSTFDGVVVPTFRPDDILDPTRPEWATNLEKLERVTGRPVASLDGLLEAIASRRRFFKSAGATATDHGHQSALTLDLDPGEAAEIYERLQEGLAEPADALRFSAHMLCQMARLSCSDGLVMQLHPGVVRNHDQASALRFGRDIGADFPAVTSFTTDLAPLLREYGSREMTIVLYTVDETAYGREIAPMASYYPAVRIGAPWWFLDTPDAMRRCWSSAVDSAGFWNFAGFVDDSRSLCSIPARHDMARRVVSGELARQVCEHRLSIGSAVEVARAYSYDMAKEVFRLTERLAEA